MKKNIIKAMAAGILTLGLVSCENSEVEFPDYEGGITVYFAYQTPVRSMMLGTDDLGSTADNDSRTCKIYGTMGGAYSGKNINVEVAVDESLCNNLYFDAACTQPVVAMPSSHYQLSGTTLKYDGDVKGGIDVKLTDAFFADPKACTVNYVIPVVMKSQTGANRILTGELGPGVESANRFDEDSWSVQPKDYVLYCVKYVSKFEGYYLPMGTAKTTFNGTTTTKEIKYADWESVQTGDILYFETTGENVVTTPVSTTGEKTISVINKDGVSEDITLSSTYKGTIALNFSGNNCTAAAVGKGTYEHQEWNDETKATYTVTEEVDLTVSGSGTYTDSSSTYKWGAKDRAGLKISYKVDWGTAQLDVDYDMALQRRGQGNTVQEFTVTLKK